MIPPIWAEVIANAFVAALVAFAAVVLIASALSLVFCTLVIVVVWYREAIPMLVEWAQVHDYRSRLAFVRYCRRIVEDWDFDQALTYAALEGMIQLEDEERIGKTYPRPKERNQAW